jgi:hypothetical protein
MVCVVPKSSLPSWLRAKALFEFVQVPTTNALSDVAPSPVPPSDGGGSHWVVDAWGGMTVRQASADLLINGGGHTNYAGNEIYAITLTQDSPAYRRAWGPTPTGSVNTTSDYYDDGNPAAQHTYYFLQYDAAADRLMRMVGGTYTVGGLHTPISSWNWGAANWNASGTHPNVAGSNFDTGGCCMDPVTGNIYLWDGTWSRTWRKATNDWDFDQFATKANRTYNAMAFDPARGCAWSIGSNANTSSGQVQKWNIAANTYLDISVTGDAAVAATTAAALGIARDPDTGNIYLYADSGVVYKFDPAALTITTVTMSGSTPASDASYGNSQGTFGKFHYVASLKAIVLKPSWTSPLFAFRVELTHGNP